MMDEIICKECGHTINWHSSGGCHDDLPNDKTCGCRLSPNDIMQSQLTALQAAAREVVNAALGVHDKSVPDHFQAHLTVGDIRKLAALLPAPSAQAGE